MLQGLGENIYSCLLQEAKENASCGAHFLFNGWSVYISLYPQYVLAIGNIRAVVPH